jgi:hypothetical protein
MPRTISIAYATANKGRIPGVIIKLIPPRLGGVVRFLLESRFLGPFWRLDANYPMADRHVICSIGQPG